MINDGLPIVDKHKVVVLTITYNHVKFIEDTLNGFAMQQTDFPFLCCVFDDASIDGEQEVLKHWVETHCNSNEVEVYDHPLTIILKAPDKNNPNCIYVIHLQKINTWGKPEKRELLNHWKQFGEYIALCEGDDYWTHPLKLKKQVGFMDANTDYSMCFGDAIYYDVDSGKDTKLNTRYRDVNLSLTSSTQDEIFFKIINSKCIIRTLCVLYRSESFQLIEPNPYPFMMGDVPLWLDLLDKGKIYYFDEIFGVYNLQSGSITHDRKVIRRFKLSMYEMRVHYLQKYGYEIPTAVKLRYNFSYYDYILSTSLPYDKEPIFPPFNINCIYDNLSRFIRQTNLYKYLFRKNSKLITYIRHVVINLFA